MKPVTPSSFAHLARRLPARALLLAALTAGMAHSATMAQAADVAQAAPLLVVVPAPSASARQYAAYFPQLLALALDKTRISDGPYEIRSFPSPLSSPRQAVEVRDHGVINLMWDGSNKQRETQLLPIRISLLHELNDYRVFLIRRDETARFAAIATLDQLRALRAGAGVNWPSTDILRANGLPVVTSIAYEYLFPMLRAKRFDYMPRGIVEAWYEQRAHADEGLVVESSIVLHYPVPFYFFVSRDNPVLAARVERGLRIAQRDGSFERLFDSFPGFRRARAEISAGRRRVFALRSE